MRSLGALVIPLYFIATVSFVLNLNRGGIGKITRRTALMAVLMFVAEFLIYSLIVGLAVLLIGQVFILITERYADALELINEIIVTLNAETNWMPVENIDEAITLAQALATEQLTLILLRNLPSFNIFLDQLLCLLMCLFFCFIPKWVNTRKKLIIYRLAGLIPVMYILATFVLNGLTQSGYLEPNLILMCIFPAKRLPHFLFIGCMIFCNRCQPIRTLDCKSGFTCVYTSKKVYRATPLVFETAGAAKKRALTAAFFLSVCLLILSAIDFCLGYLPSAAKWGLGKSYYAVFCIPFLFFYDDRKPTVKSRYSLFSVFYLFVIATIVAIYLFV